MSKVAFLFPGQGSQRVGMGSVLAWRFPEIREQYFDRAELLLPGITRLLFDGPEEDLVRTENQQPGIFLVSVAIDAVLREAGVLPEAVAGHSLGEYSALVSAGSLSFEDGLRLTRRRGELMAGVSSRTGGIMAAILGLPAEEVERACSDASSLGVVEPANYNAPTQIVISGEEPAVRRAMEIVKERGAKRAIELPVSAPFHCRLMAPLAAEFSAALDSADMVDARIPVVANVTAEYEQDVATIRRNLVRQLDGPVRWTTSIETLLADGFDIFVEVGPGKVLSGLVRQIESSVQSYSTNDPDGIEKVVQEITSRR